MTFTRVMFSQHTAVLARLIGVTLNFFVTCWAGWIAAMLCWGAYPIHGWYLAIAFFLLGLVVWAVTSVGDWLWSLEEGWFGLQRMMRVVQWAIIAGGLFAYFLFRVIYLIKGC